MITVIQIMDRFKKAVTRKISKYLIYCNKTQELINYYRKGNHIKNRLI